MQSVESQTQKKKERLKLLRAGGGVENWFSQSGSMDGSECKIRSWSSGSATNFEQWQYKK